MTDNYRGSCLCGNIKYNVSGFGAQVANCHCTMCRKFHGAAYGTLVSVKNLRWQSGEQYLKHYTASNGSVRTFCSCCGSSIGFRVKDTPVDNIEIAIATFDDDIPVEVDAQIYTNYKANWTTVQPNLPAFGESRKSG